MNFEDLTTEQKEKAISCKTPEEVLELAKQEGIELTDEQLEECGVSPDLVRFSVGIEDADDIIADIQQALDKI